MTIFWFKKTKVTKDKFCDKIKLNEFIKTISFILILFGIAISFKVFWL